MNIIQMKWILGETSTLVKHYVFFHSLGSNENIRGGFLVKNITITHYYYSSLLDFPFVISKWIAGHKIPVKDREQFVRKLGYRTIIAKILLQE